MHTYKIISILNREYLNLAEEFNFDTNQYPLKIIDWIDYINFLYNTSYIEDESIETAKELIDEINSDSITYKHSTMHCKYILIDNKIKHFIIVPIESIHKILAETTATDSEIEEYFRICLRHEVGHILSQIEMMNEYKDAKKAIKAFNYSSRRAEEAYITYMDVLTEKFENDESMSEYDYYNTLISKYYSYKPEFLANAFAKVNTKQLIKLELVIQYGFRER